MVNVHLWRAPCVTTLFLGKGEFGQRRWFIETGEARLLKQFGGSIKQRKFICGCWREGGVRVHQALAWFYPDKFRRGAVHPLCKQTVRQFATFSFLIKWMRASKRKLINIHPQFNSVMDIKSVKTCNHFEYFGDNRPPVWRRPPSQVITRKPFDILVRWIPLLVLPLFLSSFHYKD